MFHSWHQSVSTIILRLRKVEFFKYIYVTNILFIVFVKFEIKQDQFCVWFSLIQPPTETAQVGLYYAIMKISGCIIMLNHQIRFIYYLQYQKTMVTSSFVLVHQTSSLLLISLLLQCWSGADKESLYIPLSLVGLKLIHNNQRKPKANLQRSP